jgi:prepilin-type N-terminal cleavage/methylation domain-containing protein
MSRNREISSGFTLIESLVVIALILVFAAASSPLYGNLYASSQLNEAALQIVQTLRTARERSVSGFGNAGHGVYFERNEPGDDAYVLYRGTSFAGRDPAFDVATTLDSPLSLSGTMDIHFTQGIGAPSVMGTITVTHTVFGQRVIRVGGFGLVEFEE